MNKIIEWLKDFAEEWDIKGVAILIGVITAAVFIIFWIVMFIMSFGNTENKSDTKGIFESDRFIHEIDKVSMEYESYVITDKQTGAQYLLIDDVDGVAIIKLERGK